MSLQSIFNILQQNNDPLIENLTTYQQFAEYMRAADSDEMNDEDTTSDQDDQKKVAATLNLRRYVYDKYVLGGASGSTPAAALDVAPPYFVLHTDDSSVDATDFTSNTPLHLKRAIKYNKIIDLLEPPLQQKQDQINALKSPPSLIKQALMDNPSQTPHRIWKTNDEYLNILYDHLYRIWKEIYRHPSAWPFYKPVTEDVAPQYYDIITNPIDLSTMQRSLKNMTYTSKQEFFNDIYLMCENCRTYNTDLESPFRHKGNEIEDLARLLQNTVPDVIYVDRSGEDAKFLPHLTHQPQPLVSAADETLIDEVLGLEQDLAQEEQDRIASLNSAKQEEASDTKARRGRGRRAARKEEDSSTDVQSLESPSSLWLQKMSQFHNSYLSYRHHQRALPFEEQDAVARTPESMARYFLEYQGYDLEADTSDDTTKPKEYRVVRRSSDRISTTLPEYMPPGSIIPDLKHSSTMCFKNSQFTMSSPRGEKMLNQMLGSLMVPSIGAALTTHDTNQRVFDMLQRTDKVSTQTRGILQIQEMRLRQLNYLEEAQEVSLTDASSPGETLVTDAHTELPVMPALRALVALFAAHSGFTHITSDSLDILSEVVDHYITSLGQNLNQFMRINTEVEEPVALLRVLGVMGERTSTPLMKKEWDDLIVGMDGVISRSKAKFEQPQASQSGVAAPQPNNGVPPAPNSATTDGADQSTTEDRKRKREDEPFQAYKQLARPAV